eukprot:4011445-Prorocentrum_lima.AAC.1
MFRGLPAVPLTVVAGLERRIVREILGKLSDITTSGAGMAAELDSPRGDDELDSPRGDAVVSPRGGLLYCPSGDMTGSPREDALPRKPSLCEEPP